MLSGPARDRRRRLRQRPRPAAPLVAVGFLAFQAVIVLTLALALGTRLPSIAAGAITVVLFGLGWFAGVLGNVAVAFGATPLAGSADVIRVLLPTDGLWRGVVYGLEPPLVLLLAAGRERGGARASPFFAARRRRPRSSPGASRGSCSCCSAASRCSGGGSCDPPCRLADGFVSNRLQRSGDAPAGFRRCRPTETSAATVFVPATRSA